MHILASLPCTANRAWRRLTELTPGQSDYLGIPVGGPYKSDHYRY